MVPGICQARGLFTNMRRFVLLATTLLLPGCAGSGFYSYLGDTFTPPYHSNPNIAAGSSETYGKVRGQDAQAQPPILYEPGDVWPPPPKAPPTLKDMQRQQSAEMNGGLTPPGGYTPLSQNLPELPGYEIPKQQSYAPTPGANFPAGVVPLPHGGHVPTGGAGGLNQINGPTGNGSIVVPNGNGTSTVIGPNGNVTTIPTPGK
jgi:hypothetical protein